MKVARIYLDRKYLSEWYGIKDDDFIITNIKGDYNAVEFDLIFNDSVEIESTEVNNALSGNIRRQKLNGGM